MHGATQPPKKQSPPAPMAAAIAPADASGSLVPGDVIPGTPAR